MPKDRSNTISTNSSRELFTHSNMLSMAYTDIIQALTNSSI